MTRWYGICRRQCLRQGPCPNKYYDSHIIVRQPCGSGVQGSVSMALTGSSSELLTFPCSNPAEWYLLTSIAQLLYAISVKKVAPGLPLKFVSRGAALQDIHVAKCSQLSTRYSLIYIQSSPKASCAPLRLVLGGRGFPL